MSQTFTPKMKKPNIVILNGIVEQVQPVQTQDARRWQLFNYQRDAVFLCLQTDHEIYGGHHPVFVTSSQAAEIASTYAHCRTHQMPLAVTVTGSLYSRGDQSLTIASHVVCHIPREDQEQVRRYMASVSGALPADDQARGADASV